MHNNCIGFTISVGTKSMQTSEHQRMKNQDPAVVTWFVRALRSHSVDVTLCSNGGSNPTWGEILQYQTSNTCMAMRVPSTKDCSFTLLSKFVL